MRVLGTELESFGYAAGTLIADYFPTITFVLYYLGIEPDLMLAR